LHRLGSAAVRSHDDRRRPRRLRKRDAITLDPYVAAARFVLSGSDLDRNIKQTATQIAEQVSRRVAESAAPR
jgi:hypothetical protein